MVRESWSRRCRCRKSIRPRRSSTHSATCRPRAPSSGAADHRPAATGRQPMKSPVTGIALLIALFVVVVVGYSSLFTVDQTQQVLVVRLGEPQGGGITEPGLHFKAPFIDTVISI